MGADLTNLVNAQDMKSRRIADKKDILLLQHKVGG